MHDSDDAADVIAALHKILRAVDSRDWTTYRAMMTDRLEIDYGGVGGANQGWVDAGDIVSSTRARLEPLHASQHLVSNHVVEFDGDEATIHFYERALHYHPALGPDEAVNSWVLHADCTRRFRRTPEGWRQCAVFVRVIRNEGNAELLQQIADREN